MIDIKLKNFQEEAVDFLFDKTTNSNSKPKIVMQSPRRILDIAKDNSQVKYILNDKDIKKFYDKIERMNSKMIK